MKMLRQYLSLNPPQEEKSEKDRAQELFERAAQFRTMARDIMVLADEAEADAMALVGPNLDRVPEKNKHESCSKSRFLESVEYHLHVRKIREKYFGKKIFGEPAWDILLELYVSELQDKKISTSNLILSSSYSSSTAMRWIKNLEENSMIFKSPSKIDGRVQYQRISKAAFDQMTSYFERIILD